MEKAIAFIGFGEAAFYISKGLAEQGCALMKTYDSNWQDPQRGAVIVKRAQEAKVELCSTPDEAIAGADFVLSLTSAKVAEAVARDILPRMSTGQVFLDMNSASPQTKRKIGEIPRPQGVKVCDTAIMASVPMNGHRVPLLMSGAGGDEFAKAMDGYGMRIEVLDAPLGGASAVKMMRSVFMKGYPQVLLECLLAAEEYGVTEQILDSLEESVGGKTVRQLADQLFSATSIHASRRASEMDEVVDTLNEMGLESDMSNAARSRLYNLAKLNMIEILGSDGKMPYQKLVPLLLRRIKSRNNTP